MDRFTEMQVFARVAESGSFTAAARDLSLTPSGVSKLVARLEDRLGALLFKRTSRDVVLTPEGAAYFDQVTAILAAVEAAESKISEAKQPISGTLRVFLTEGFASQQIAPLMPEFHRNFPDVRVEFYFASGALRMLDSAMDVGFYPFAMQDSAMVSRKLVGTRWCICASPGYLAEYGSPSRPSEIAERKCLNFSANVPCNNWQIWDEKSSEIVRIRPHGVAGASDSSMIAAMAREGLGIARLLEHNISNDLDEGRLVELFPAPPGILEETIHVVYHSRRHLPARASVFLEFLQTTLAKYRTTWRKKDIRRVCAQSNIHAFVRPLVPAHQKL